jgi:hypothetical protein
MKKYHYLLLACFMLPGVLSAYFEQQTPSEFLGYGIPAFGGKAIYQYSSPFEITPNNHILQTVDGRFGFQNHTIPSDCINTTSNSVNILLNPSRRFVFPFYTWQLYYGCVNQTSGNDITIFFNSTSTPTNVSITNLVSSSPEGLGNFMVDGNYDTGAYCSYTQGSSCNNLFPYNKYNYDEGTNDYNITVFDARVFWYYEHNLTGSIFDEDTLTLITETLNYEIYEDESFYFNGTTNTGTFTYNNITGGDYILKIYNNNYTARYYEINIPQNTGITTKNAYLARNTQNLTLNIRSQSAQLQALENALISIEYQPNSTWVVVEERYSDVSGTAVVAYRNNIRYRFTVSAQGFVTKTFILDPVQFDQYNIYLDPIEASNRITEAIITYNPKIAADNSTTTVQVSFNALYNNLQNYTVVLVYPGGTNTSTGFNPSGSTLNLGVTLSSLTGLQYINATTTYTTSNGVYTNTFNIPIFGGSEYSTWEDSKDNTFGMGDFEREVVATGMIIIIGAVAFLYTGAVGGGFITLLLMGFFVTIGFFNLFAAVPVMVVGGLLVLWRGSQ